MASTDYVPGRFNGLHRKVLGELGLLTLWRSSLDVKVLCAQRFIRLFAYGGSTLILASYLSALSISDDRIGLFMTLTLVGDVAISFFLTLFADAMGRRAVLALGSALMACSGIVFGLFGNYWILLAAAVLGVISPSGNEIGPFRAVEESTLAHLTAKEHLSDIFVWYSLIGTAGTAIGMMVCGWIINLLQTTRGWQYLHACQIVFFAYAAIGAVKFLLSICLSHEVEAAKKDKNGATASQQQQRAADGLETQPLLGERANNEDNQKKSIFSFLGSSDLISLVVTLFVLFGLDSFASGLASLCVLVAP
jgi:MFS family permease